MSIDGIKWHAFARVVKYDPSTVAEITKDLGRTPNGSDLRMLEERHGLKPDGITEADGNLLTTAGLHRLTALFTAIGATQAFTNLRGAVGVGDNTTPATVTDAALTGNSATHSWWQGVDASYPTQVNGVITAYSTFGINDGNFAWNEWGWGIATAAITGNAIFNTATTTGTLINHKVQNLGTKVSGAIWTHQGTITIS